MAGKGYNFESEIEDFFLEMENKNKHTPLLVFDERGFLKVNRSFRVPASGAMDSIKGDIITANEKFTRQFKVECKSRLEKTKRDGQIVHAEKEWITKNEREAKEDNQVPVLCFSFKRVQKNRIWWLMKEEDFKAYIYHEECYLGSPEVIKPKQSKKKDVLTFILKDLKSGYYCFEDKELCGKYILSSHVLFKWALERRFM